MNEKILTWNISSNNGAFQKNTEYGIFSDLLTEKPDLGFSYNEIYYNETINEFHVDGVELTEEQKNKILNFIIAYEVPKSFYFNSKVLESVFLLKNTDYISSKYIEQVIISKTCTEEEFSVKYADLLQKRQEARDTIAALEIEYGIKL